MSFIAKLAVSPAGTQGSQACGPIKSASVPEGHMVLSLPLGLLDHANQHYVQEPPVPWGGRGVPCN